MLKQGGDVRKPWIPRTPPLINTLAQSTRRHIPPATPPRPVGMPGVIRYAAFRYCCGSYVCSMRSLSYVCSIPLREVAIPPPPLPFEQVYVEQVFESATLPLLEQVFEYDTQRIESLSVGGWVRTCVRGYSVCCLSCIACTPLLSNKCSLFRYSVLVCVSVASAARIAESMGTHVRTDTHTPYTPD